MFELFHSAIYQPIYNVLIYFYNVIPGQDFGIAIIVTTLFLKLLMTPLSQKQIESQRKMQILQPKVKELQAKYKDRKEEQTKALLELYKTEKTNPFSGCLPLVVQIIFLIAIYKVIITISQANFMVNEADLYFFVTNPGVVNHLFLSVIDLSKPSIILALLSATTQYFQTKGMLETQGTLDKKIDWSAKDPDFSAMMGKQMLYLGPGITLFIGITFPAALSLYWFVSALFMLVQQKILFYKMKEDTTL
jgi:YidC/Oxa1 family membrane protein insertase